MLKKFGKDVVQRIGIWSGSVFEGIATPGNIFILNLPMPFTSPAVPSQKLPAHGSAKQGPNAAWSQWSGELKGPVRVSNLKSCVGLVLVGKAKGSELPSTVAPIHKVLVFHLGGVGSKYDRKSSGQAWGKVLEGVPAEIGNVIGKSWNNVEIVHSFAVAGPAHPGTSSDFEQDYQALIKPARDLEGKTFMHEMLFWTGGNNNPNVPSPHAPTAAMQLASDGTGYACHER